MKSSRFNIFIAHEDKWILFNTLSQKTMIISPELKDIFNNCNENISQVHPTFYDALILNKMLIPDMENELEEVQKLIHNIDFAEDSYRLIINPTLDCNFHCWYCYENHIKGSRMSSKTIEKVKLFINRITEHEKLKEFRLSFFGGEPLLYFKQVIKPIMQYAIEVTRNKDIRLISHITSNAYLINSTILSSLKELRVHSFQITLDGDKEMHDKTRYIAPQIGSYNKIIQNIKSLVSIGIYVILRMNFTKENIDGMKTIIDDLSDLSMADKKLIILSLNQVWQDKKTENDDIYAKVANIKDYAKQQGIHTNSVLSSDTVRNSCYADRFNQAVINFDGLVYKCNARNFVAQKAEGILSDSGEIVWNSLFYKRMGIKLKNKPCLNCAILPMCGGGCRQYSIEHEQRDYCLHDFNEEKKIRFVKEVLFNDSLEFEII